MRPKDARLSDIWKTFLVGVVFMVVYGLVSALYFLFMGV